MICDKTIRLSVGMYGPSIFDVASVASRKSRDWSSSDPSDMSSASSSSSCLPTDLLKLKPRTAVSRILRISLAKLLAFLLPPASFFFTFSAKDLIIDDLLYLCEEASFTTVAGEHYELKVGMNAGTPAIVVRDLGSAKDIGKGKCDKIGQRTESLDRYAGTGRYEANRIGAYSCWGY